MPEPVVLGTTLDIARATDILKTQEDKLHLLAQAMLEYETLTGDEIKQLLDSGAIDRPGEPAVSTVKPVRGSAIPKSGRRFGGEAPAASCLPGLDHGLCVPGCRSR